MRRPRGPFGFVLAVVGCWVAGRSAVLMWQDAGHAEETLAAPAAARPPRPMDPAASRAIATLQFEPAALPSESAERPSGQSMAEVAPSPVSFAPPAEAGASATPVTAVAAEPVWRPASSAAAALAQPGGRFSASAWALLRQGGGASLAAAGGQLGGSQAGLRLRYALGRDAAAGLALFGRVAAPLEQRRGKEAALGLEWRPLAGVPLSLAAERRIALDRGGRDAFALGLFGGVDGVALPAGLRLDAYAQAGVVGLERRDAYVDGQARIERPLLRTGALELSAGAGVWGAAQPAASRLDVGPQLVMRAPLGDRTLRLNLDWRARVAGDARPGSGVALTLATDF